MDAESVALRFCDDQYPDATTIVLGGSSSTGRRTATSDIDILLIAPATAFGEGSDSDARVVHREGERIDVFAYTVEAFRDWSERDFASLRPVLPFLLTEGSPLRIGDEFDELHRWSAERLARGPSLSPHQLELRRYAITDLLDDFTDANDPLQITAIRADLFRSLAELALLRSDAWLGSGKWLARRLHAADPRSAEALARFATESGTAAAADVAAALLDDLGGRVDSDFVR
ncbi:nucleotidyltransferase domain-containing protein [Leifsonia sp. 2MCAF36]|uniref:nucleotidyltransferase domain-containing protein n=1 Tax=Leifsonia sp. 2MCAF36 TaxID=3232988 RepID=UPI003F9BABFD